MNAAPPLATATDTAFELQALLDAAVDAIVVIDHIGTILTFSRAAERIFGYEAHEVLGCTVDILMNDEDRQSHGSHLAQYLASCIPRIIGRGHEIEVRRKNGTLFPASLAVGLIPESNPPRFVGFVRDNSAQHESEAEAHRLQDRLMHVARLATVGEMASGIAHELNQPLAAIATYAHACDRLLGGADPDVEEVQGALKQIAEQAVRAGNIIRKLRGLAKSERPTRVPSDVNQVIAELNLLIESDAKAHGVDYRRDLQPNLPQVVLDSSQIQQVVMNLVHNALDSLALAQVETGELVVQTRRTGAGDVEISVCDNGGGVQEAIVNRMFDPFCSTKPTGTGLGLPISRTIVTAHDGRLEYSPNEPRGACFKVQLPAMRAEPVSA
ncbi:MAG: PAS domain S-box protein [Proteobacteria bacterium]|nr:PAS domain S-box protein [Pseudomonadota bacterium]